MSVNWVSVAIGAGSIFFGFFATGVRGAMPGSSPGYPPPLRMRVILIGFGAFFVLYGLLGGQ
jgi:hypothetical protein